MMDWFYSLSLFHRVGIVALLFIVLAWGLPGLGLWWDYRKTTRDFEKGRDPVLGTDAYQPERRAQLKAIQARKS